MRGLFGFLAGLMVLFVLFSSSIYTVSQTEQAILLRLGVVQLDQNNQPIVVGPGLHFKAPFITSVVRVDMRLQTLDLDSSRIVTSEQKDVLVDAFVKWRINDIVQFYTSTSGDFDRANILLRQKVLDGLRAEFGKETIAELVAGQRSQVMQEIQRNSNNVAQPLGIEVTDVRVKRIDLPNEVLASVYQRMRSDREKEATLIRAEGKQEAMQIRSQADAEVTVTLSTAKAAAADLQAKGTSEAAQIYSTSYQKAPKFFEFYRSLEAYQTAFSSGKNTFVLSPTGQFFNDFMPTQLSN
jgi:membrane protease subunit HflC